MKRIRLMYICITVHNSFHFSTSVCLVIYVRKNRFFMILKVSDPLKGEKSFIVDLTFVDPRLTLTRVSTLAAIAGLSHISFSWQQIWQEWRRERNAHQLLVTGKLPLAFWREHLSKEQQLRQGLKASHVPSHRHAMLRCIQSWIIADDIQSTGGTSTLRYYVKNAFVLGDDNKEQLVDCFM